MSPRPPLRLSRPRVEILPSGGGRDEEAPARPGLCAPHAPRSLSAAQGRSIAAPRPRRRGGSGTAACIGAITVSARPRWRPEAVRGSGAGSGAGAGPGSPGRPRPARGEAPPPRRPPGEKAAVPRSACACPPAGVRPGSGPGSCSTPFRDKDPARGLAALAPQGSSAGGRRHSHQGDCPCDCLQPGSPFTDHTYSCSLAPPSQTMPTCMPHGARRPLAQCNHRLYPLPLWPSPYLTQPVFLTIGIRA